MGEPENPPQPASGVNPPNANLNDVLKFVQDQQKVVLEEVQKQQQQDRQHIQFLLKALGIVLTIAVFVFGWLGLKSVDDTVKLLVSQKFQEDKVQKTFNDVVTGEVRKLEKSVTDKTQGIVDNEVTNKIPERVRKSVDLEFQKREADIRRMIDDQAKKIVSERFKARALTDDQLERFYAWLQKEKARVYVSAAGTDQDSMNLRHRIMDTKLRAQFPEDPIAGGALMGPGPSCIGEQGILVSAYSVEDAKKFISFLADLGLTAQINPTKTFQAKSNKEFEMRICPKS